MRSLRVVIDVVGPKSDLTALTAEIRVTTCKKLHATSSTEKYFIVHDF
jgi:hypothetical protein